MQPLIFRAAGIARPICILIAIRLISYGDAALYAHIFSQFIICLEVYNVCFPSDGLYKKSEGFEEAVRIVRARLRVGPLITLISVGMWGALSNSFGKALLTSILALIAGVLVPLYAFAFARLRSAILIRLEIFFHAAAVLAVLAWWTTSNIWIVLIFAMSEISLKALVIVWLEYRKKFLETIFTFSSLPKTPLRCEMLQGIRQGVPLTLANYVFRLPFAVHLPSGTLDPMLLLGAQFISSAYNLVLVIHSSRLLVWVRRAAVACPTVGALLSIVMCAAGFQNVAVGVFIFSFGVSYAYWLSTLSGTQGVLAGKASQWTILMPLIGIIVLAAIVQPGWIWAGLFLPLIHLLLRRFDRHVTIL